jgi:hypothetical protein
MGTEQGLGNRLVEITDYRINSKKKKSTTLLKPPKHYYPKISGSLNHKGLFHVCNLGTAYIYNDKAEIAKYETALISFLREQEIRGHCCVAKAIETLSGSHGQLNLSWASAAYLLWCYYGQSEELGKLLVRWHWSEISLFRNCKLPDKYLSDNGYSPTWHCPGWRAIKGEKGKGKNKEKNENESAGDGILTTSNPGRDLYGRVVLGLDIPSSDRDLWNDKYNLGAYCVLNLSDSERNKLIPADDWKAPVPYDYAIWTHGDGFVSAFNAPTHPDVCLSVGYSEITGPFIDKDWHNNRSIFGSDIHTKIFPATKWSQENRPQP